LNILNNAIDSVVVGENAKDATTSFASKTTGTVLTAFATTATATTGSSRVVGRVSVVWAWSEGGEGWLQCSWFAAFGATTATATATGPVGLPWIANLAYSGQVKSARITGIALHPWSAIHTFKPICAIGTMVQLRSLTVCIDQTLH
jgi:hypothetical protein